MRGREREREAWRGGYPRESIGASVAGGCATRAFSLSPRPPPVAPSPLRVCLLAQALPPPAPPRESWSPNPRKPCKARSARPPPPSARPRPAHEPAEPRRVPARAALAPPDPPGRHVGASGARASRPSAPQAVAGTLADGQWRAETKHVPAGWAVEAGMGRYTAWGALGTHVGPAGGPVGAAKGGVLPAMNLLSVNYTRPLFRVLERAGRVPCSWVEPTKLPQPPGRHKIAAFAIWFSRPAARSAQGCSEPTIFQLRFGT